jgi:hypothetical protein
LDRGFSLAPHQPQPPSANPIHSNPDHLTSLSHPKATTPCWLAKHPAQPKSPTSSQPRFVSSSRCSDHHLLRPRPKSLEAQAIQSFLPLLESSLLLTTTRPRSSLPSALLTQLDLNLDTLLPLSDLYVPSINPFFYYTHIFSSAG